MDEKEVKTRLKNARQSIQNKTFNEALHICEQILQADPSNYVALVFAGRCHVELDSPTAARECYGRAASIDESQLLAWQGLLQLYEKYCIWDENCVSCLRHLVALTSEEKKRDYHFQLATTLAKAGRLEESAAEFLLLRSINGDDSWRIQIEEAVLRYLGEAVLGNDGEIELVKKCFAQCIDRADSADKVSLELKFSHFLVQNQCYTEAYELFTSLDVTKDHGQTFLCDFVSLLCERYMQGSFSDADEELLAKINECFDEEETATTGTGIVSAASTAASALTDFIDQNWGDLVETLKPEKLRALKSPFLWYLLSEVQLRVHGYFEAIAAAEEAQRGWGGQYHHIHRLKAAVVEANSHLEIGASTSLKKASAIYSEVLSRVRDLRMKGDQWKTTIQLDLARTLAADGSLEKAVEVLKGVQDQSAPDYLVTKASVYLKFGMYAECQAAIEEAQSVVNDSEDDVKAKFHYVQGRILWDTDKEKNLALKEFAQAARLDPYLANSYFYIALYYDHLSDSKFNEKALKCYERAYSLDGRYNWKMGSSLSDAYRKSGAHEKNLALLLEITQAQPAEKCSWAWLRLGLEYLSEGKADDAVQVLQTVLRLVDSDIRCWECLGEAYAMRGSYASAVKTFEKVVELESEERKVAYAKYRTAMINLIMQRHEEAARGFRDVMKSEQANLSAVIGLGHSLVELSKHYFSEARFQRSLDVCVEAIGILAPIVVSKPRSPSGWYLLGSALTMVKDFPSVELEKMAFPDFKTFFSEHDFKNDKSDLLKLGSRCFAQTIQLNSKVAQVWHDLGINLFFQASAVEGEEAVEELVSQSLTCLKHAVQLEPSKARFWLSLANAATSRLVDQPELAQHGFIKSLSLEPHQAAAWTALGVLYKKHDEIQLAHKCFERAQSVDPDYANCWVGQAAIAEEVQPKEALDLFRHAVELENNAQGFLGYGYHILLTMEDPDVDHASLEYQYAIEHLRAVPVAQVALQKYCFLNPADPCALNMLGLLLEQENMFNTAGSVYLSALETLKSSKATDANAEEFVMGNTCRLFGKLGNSAMMRKLAGKMVTRSTFDNLCMRGLAYYRLGQLDKAVEMYAQAVYASGTNMDQMAVNCAFSLIAAKQGDWKKMAALDQDSSVKEYALWIFWTSVSGLLETGSLDMKRIRSGFAQLSKLSAGTEWLTLLAAIVCLYSDGLSLVDAQWLLHLLPYDFNVRFAFERIWRKCEAEWAGNASQSGIPALAKWQAVTRLKESRRKEVLYAKIKHMYPDLFSL